MIFLLFIICYSNECSSMNINVGCLNGRRIDQFEPVTITVYPFNFNENDNKLSTFYYDFGDGSNLVTDELYVKHVYYSSGEFILKVVRTDTATNISSDGSIDCYAQTIIYVFPHDSQYMFQLLSQDEINDEQNDNFQLNMHVIEIPLGKSTWYLRLIETTNSYFGNFMESFNENLGRYSYMPSITTGNEDLLHTIHYNKQHKCYEIEFNYIGTGMQSFTLKFNFNISIGSLIPLSTEYIATTKIIKFSDKLQKEGSNLRDIKPIPYFPSGAVAMNEDNHSIITNNNFYDWTEMDEKVDGICASSSRVYFIKNGLIYYHELNSDEIKKSISLDNVIDGIKISEYDTFKLFGSPRSSFRKAEEIDAPDQILLFINSTMYRITGNLNESSYTEIELENITNVLFASAYLDPRVTVIIYENDNKFYRAKIDNVQSKTEIQDLKIDNLTIAFMHDFTKKMIFINDSYIFLSSDLGISMQIVYILQDDEIVINYASSLGFDEVTVYTSAGRAIMISPELGIATVLFTLPRKSDENPVFIYNYDDSLFVHLDELSLRIPTESLIKVLTYSLPGGNDAKFWLEKDYGDTLQFSILTPINQGTDTIVNYSKNSHYPPGFLPLDDSKYDLNHLSLYGTTEECKFIYGSSRCEVLSFDNVIKQILASGSTWALKEDSGKAQMRINSNYFNNKMIGITISIPTIKLIFIIDEIMNGSEVIGTISLDPDNFELTTEENPRQFSFFRAIDIRNQIEYDSDGVVLSVTDTTNEGQKILLDKVNYSQIYFNSSMVGMSLLIDSGTDKQEDLYYPILKVVDNDAAVVIRKKNNPKFVRETSYSNWKITYDPNINTNNFFRKSWSLRYSWCNPISDPSFYYPIYSIRSMSSCKFDLNISSYSSMNTRIISNERFTTISNVSPNNVSISITTPKEDYSLSSFIFSIRDSSPQCKHTYLLGISKKCSNNIRLFANFDTLESIPIPKVNYRTPSEHGMMISTSPYVYNVNLSIHEYNYKDKLKISQGYFNPAECSSSSKDINDMIESATNCLTHAYKAKYGSPIKARFSLQEYRIIDWESYGNNFTINVKEINGRNDLCIAGKCQVNEREMKPVDSIVITGKELYHFKFTVNITGCLYTKYAVFWCDQILLSKSYVFLTIAIVLFICVLILEVIYYYVMT